jgi:molybdenum cofactor synthesis domain-containing protein
MLESPAHGAPRRATFPAGATGGRNAVSATALPDLIPLDEAQRRVLDGVVPLPSAIVDLGEADGLVLAGPVVSPLTVPTWANSAMDGFAVVAADVATASPSTPVTLRVVGEVPAGRAPDASVKPGAALRIMTGAMMPPGADTVVPVEDTDAAPGASAIPETVAIRAAWRAGDNVRAAGTDVREGAHLLDAGRACDPAAIALLAATGIARVEVHRRPRVAVISTGDELVPPGEPLGPAQIHDANSPSLAAQATEAGAEVRRLGIARDTLPALLELVREAVAWADVVVLSGGVSVGAHDHVKAAFEDVGTLSLWRVAIKPGRPFAFARARSGDRTVHLFGLPGNPVSVFVTFELFVRPVLRILAGHPRAFDRPVRIARLGEPMRGSSGRQNIHRVVLAADPERPDGVIARSSGGQDSYMLASLAAANALVFIPADADLPAGAEVVAWELRGRDA